MHGTSYKLRSTLKASGGKMNFARYMISAAATAFILTITTFAQQQGPITHSMQTYRTRHLTVNPTSLNFGTVSLNSISTQTIKLTSTGSGSITIEGLTVTGTGFTLAAPSVPVTLAPGQAVSIQVRFDPTVAGAATGSISISTNSRMSGATAISLNGTGAGTTGNPVLTISATSLSFGSVSVGTPTVQSLTLTSTGTAAVTVSGASLSGAGFTVTGATFPVTLTPGVAIKLQVQFDPTAVGSFAGTLTISSNSSTGSSTVVSLSGAGTAVQHQVTLNWNGPANSPSPVSGYNVYRSPSGGKTFQRLNSTADSLTNYVDQAVQSGLSYTYYVTSVDAAGTESVPSNQTTVSIP
jgi:hypothetical protein